MADISRGNREPIDPTIPNLDLEIGDLAMVVNLPPQRARPRLIAFTGIRNGLIGKVVEIDPCCPYELPYLLYFGPNEEMEEIQEWFANDEITPVFQA